MLDYPKSEVAGFVNSMAAQRCEAPLIKADNSDSIQTTIQQIFSHKCYKKAEIEQKIEGLVNTLADLSDGTSKNHAAKRTEQLSQESIDIRSQIHELENLTSQNTLSDIEFDIMRRILTIFKDSIDEMSVEQKRTAVRTIIQKVVTPVFPNQQQFSFSILPMILIRLTHHMKQHRKLRQQQPNEELPAMNILPKSHTKMLQYLYRQLL